MAVSPWCSTTLLRATLSNCRETLKHHLPSVAGNCSVAELTALGMVKIVMISWVELWVMNFPGKFIEPIMRIH